uniref:S1 motif domain-containing protein n=1 Tax=Corethron hystrix TaxID=216773 RepID=A0A7S1B6H6_9STRA
MIPGGATYEHGPVRLPEVTARPQLVAVASKAEEAEDGFALPSVISQIHVGAKLIGYVERVDMRYGAFVKFLNRLTGLVPKLKKGTELKVGSTVLVKVAALDLSVPDHPKIVLERTKSKQSKEEKKKSKQEAKDKEQEMKEAKEQRKKEKEEGKAKGKEQRDLANKKLQALKAGDIVGDVEILHINAERANVRLLRPEFQAAKARTRIHCSVADPLNITRASPSATVANFDPSHPFHAWSVGDILPAVRVAAAARRLSARLYLDLTNREEACPPLPRHLGDFVVGSVAEGIVDDVVPGVGVWLRTGPAVRGRVHALELSEDVNVLNDLQRHFPVGKRLEGIVLRAAEGKLDLSVVRKEKGKDRSKLKKGQLAIGCITRKSTKKCDPPELMLEFAAGTAGRCCITELEDEGRWENMPLGNPVARSQKKGQTTGEADDVALFYDGAGTNFPHGKFVRCRVLAPASRSRPAQVSLRPSRLAEDDTEADPAPASGAVVRGFVVNTGRKGCFVRVARNRVVHVPLNDLSDGFVVDPALEFPAGRLVVGRTGGKPESGRLLQMSLRESALLDSVKLGWDDLQVKEKVKGVVTRVEAYGVFVKIDNSNVSGLCHVSEISDKKIKNHKDIFQPGDRVKAIILTLDKESKKISFGLKPSYFEGDEHSSEDEDSDSSSDEDEMDVDAAAKSDSDSEAEDYVSKLAAKTKEKKTDESDEDDSSESDSESDSGSESDSSADSSSPAAAAAGPMDTDVGFDWSGAQALAPPSAPSDDSDDDDAADPKLHTRQKAAARRRTEARVTAEETRMASGAADASPETAAEFERLLAANPNASEVWIRYMALHLSNADVDAARAVAARAFERITFREEEEKLNVWTALLTLELKYGSPAELEETLEEASRNNNPKKVYLRACELLEKEVDTVADRARAMQRADAMFEKMCKKFKSKKTTWLAHVNYLFKHSRASEANKILKRSLLSLPSHKHVEVMSRFAQMEFELGSPGRARTIFDGLLEKYPKRLDLLFVYVDKEIKGRFIGDARALFRRVTGAEGNALPVTKLNDKQMKSVFKKWYRMEEKYGTEGQVEDVKAAAQAFVERTL